MENIEAEIDKSWEYRVKVSSFLKNTVSRELTMSVESREMLLNIAEDVLKADMQMVCVKYVYERIKKDYNG